MRGDRLGRRASTAARRWAEVALLAAGALLAACGPAGGNAAGGALRTFCGWDGGGACPSVGHTTGRALLPAVVGPDHEVALSRYFTSDAVTTEGAGMVDGGLGGAAFPLRYFPPSGSLALTVAGDLSVSFLIPPFGPGRPSALSLGKQVTIPVPPGPYGALWLLEAGVGGNIGPIDVALGFVGGATAEVPVTFGDWCNGGFPLRDAPPEYVGISLPVVLTTRAAMAASASGAGGADAGAAASPAAQRVRTVRLNCGLWAEEVQLPRSSSALDSLTLPAHPGDADPDAFIMAITLQAGPPATVAPPSG